MATSPRSRTGRTCWTASEDERDPNPPARGRREPARLVRRRLSARAGGLRPRRLVRILILCLIVGLVLSMFGIGPGDFWRFAWSALSGIYDWLVGLAGSLGATVVIGACVVIPIIAIRRLWRRMSR